MASNWAFGGHLGFRQISQPAHVFASGYMKFHNLKVFTSILVYDNLRCIPGLGNLLNNMLLY